MSVKILGDHRSICHDRGLPEDRDSVFLLYPAVSGTNFAVFFTTSPIEAPLETTQMFHRWSIAVLSIGLMNSLKLCTQFVSKRFFFGC
jgi:hypothetical protein